jgi:hypothetical protein
MRHPYATDSEERTRVLFLLAALAVALAYGIHHALRGLGILAPWWIDAPSPLLIYGLLGLFFERFFWKWSWLAKVGLVEVPNLSGRWTGVIKGSYDNFSTEHAITVLIEQTWTRMSIQLQSNSSASISSVAGILLHSAEPNILTYQYRSEPKADAVETMQMHVGTTWLKISNDHTTLDGQYYTGRGRQNFGSIRLRRTE